MFRRLKTAHDNTLQHLTVEAQRDLYAHLPLPSRLTSLASNPLRVPGQTEDQHTACCPSDEQPRMKVQQHGMREAEMLQSTMAELTTTLAKTEAVLVDLDREWVALRADTLRLKQDYLQFEKDCDPDTAPHSKIRSPEDLLDDLAQYIKAVKKEISADVDDGGDADATDMWQRAVGDVLHDVGLERKLGEYVDRMSEKALREIESEEKEAKKREREMHNQIWRLVRVEVESK